MISENEEYVLGVALANERIASEIVARVIDATPASPAAAQAILDIISNSTKEEKEIEEYLIIATANRSVGREISEQLKLVVECLEYQAADDPANNAALAAAQAELANLSTKAKEYLIVALSNKIIANSISSKIDTATQSSLSVAAAAAIASYYSNDFSAAFEGYEQANGFGGSAIPSADVLTMNKFWDALSGEAAMNYNITLTDGGSFGYVHSEPTAQLDLSATPLVTITFYVAALVFDGTNTVMEITCDASEPGGMGASDTGIIGTNPSFSANGQFTTTFDFTGLNIDLATGIVGQLVFKFKPDVLDGVGSTSFEMDNFAITIA